MPYNFTTNTLKAYLSTQASSLSAFVISKTHIVAQKLRGKQLNAKVCGGKSTVFRILLCSDHWSNNDNSKTAQVLTLVLARNWCSSQHAASQPLSNLIASNSPWSTKPFTTLWGCFPLLRTPFSNFVRMRTRNLVPRPKTTLNGLEARLVHEVAIGQYTLVVSCGHTPFRKRGKGSGNFRCSRLLHRNFIYSHCASAMAA